MQLLSLLSYRWGVCFLWLFKTFLSLSCLWFEYKMLAATAKSLQSCPTLCDPIDGSLPGCPVPGILQARTLEWVAISFSKAWKWKVKGTSLSRVRPSVTPWTAAFLAPPSMGFSRQEYWNGVPLLSPVEYYSAIKKNTFESVLMGGWNWSLLYRVK